jgi:hypothetical protein
VIQEHKKHTVSTRRYHQAIDFIEDDGDQIKNDMVLQDSEKVYAIKICINMIFVPIL